MIERVPELGKEGWGREPGAFWGGKNASLC